MYRSFVTLLIGMIINTPMHGQNCSHVEKIKSAVEAELKLYPEERLLDIYKSFFQGYWGPGHLVPDSVSAHNYLTREMGNVAHYDSIPWQSLGCYDKYFRLNLKFVKDGIIPEWEYLNAFIQSANNPNKPSLSDWINEWEKVTEVIEKNDIKINNYEEDKKTITNLLAEGGYVIHHSEEFRKIYNPHYRVIAKIYFEQLMKKYLSNKNLRKNY